MKIRKARDAAKNAQKLLENASNRKKTKELEKDGLVITKAMYGKIDTTNENDYLEAIDDAASLVLDVTLPLNFLVTNSQLKVGYGYFCWIYFLMHFTFLDTFIHRYIPRSCLSY